VTCVPDPNKKKKKDVHKRNIYGFYPEVRGEKEGKKKGQCSRNGSISPGGKEEEKRVKRLKKKGRMSSENRD